MESANSSLIVVLGPTGAGKSDLALHLATRFGAEIVNCDSVQVYRGLDIGSAKTPPAQRRGIRHHLLDVVDPTVDPEADLTAGAWSRLARAALADISSRHGLPLLAGGTGFYLRSLLDGLSPAPARDPNLRQRLYKVAARRPKALHRLLQQCDPAAAGRIHANDHQKLIRALEIAADPKPLAARHPLSGYSVLKIGVNPPRAELYQCLNQRTAAMFEGGLPAETRALLDAGVPANAKSLQTLGYKQAVQVLTRQLSVVEAMEDCQTKTRQYAKRQLTWFRRERNVHWLDGFGTDAGVQSAAEQLVNDFLLNSSAAPKA